MKTEILTLNFNKICRTCVTESDEMISIHTLSNVDTENDTYTQILNFCLSAKTNEEDGLPNQICKNCFEEVARFHKFKQLCQKTDETLRCYITSAACDVKNEEIKTENDELQIKIEEEIKGDVQNERNETLRKWRARKRINLVEYDTDSDVSWQNDDSSDKEIKPKKRTMALKSSPFYCKRCEILFKTAEELAQHREKVKHPRKRNHKCSICSKAFTYSQLKVHMRSHTQEKPFNCDVCGQQFSLNCNLRRHRMIHTGERPHRCDECGKGFIQSTTLQEHIRTHSGETPFICSFCGKSFTQSGQLRTHLKKHSSENDDCSSPGHRCPICNRYFQTKGILKSHQLIHGEKKFLCSDCGRGFVSMAGLHSHTKTHTGMRPYVCNVCGKSFSQTGSLKSHTLIHTGVKPFVCNVCNRAFTQRNHLKYHLRTHSGERPYSCSVCGKNFTLNGTLTVHMRTHTGETPYYCPVCKKGFYDSSSMKKHMRCHGEGNK